MFERLESPERVLAARLSGAVDGADVAAFQAALDALLATKDEIALCVDISDLGDLSAEALRKGAAVDVDILAHAAQVARAAIGSDKMWPAALVDGFSHLIPRPELRVFPTARWNEALAWASGQTTAEPEAASLAPAPSLAVIHTSRPDVLGLEVDGMLTSESFAGVRDEVERFMAAHDKVRFVVRIKRFAGFDPTLLGDSSVYAFKLTALRKTERYAVIGAPVWASGMIDMADRLFPDMEIRSFRADEEAVAWTWIGATPPRTRLRSPSSAR